MANLNVRENVRELGEYIREQRSTAQISLRQLARLAGVSNPYLSQIERGLRRPSAEILQQIAKALRISAEVLYVQAGILEERPTGSDVPVAVLADPTINERQKQVLLQIYESFRRENAEQGGEAESPAPSRGAAAAGGRGRGTRQSTASAQAADGRKPPAGARSRTARAARAARAVRAGGPAAKSGAAAGSSAARPATSGHASVPRPTPRTRRPRPAPAEAPGPGPETGPPAGPEGIAAGAAEARAAAAEARAAAAEARAAGGERAEPGSGPPPTPPDAQPGAGARTGTGDRTRTGSRARP